MSNIIDIKPIPSREAWKGWLEELQRPGSRFLSGHYVREESFHKVRSTIIAKTVADGIPGELIARHLMQQPLNRLAA